MRLVRETYRMLFARPRFRRLNTALFHMSLSGLGILNFADDHVSGEWHFVKRELPRLLGTSAPTIFDVGANVGNFTALLLEAFPQGTIHAFEPHPATFAKLSARQFPASRVRRHNVAVGAESGSAILFDRADADTVGSSHASLYESVITGMHGRGAVPLSVNVTTLDALAEQERIAQIDFLKIDTEGHELAVLQGARGLLARRLIRCVQFEFNEMNVASRAYLNDFRQILPDYDFFRLLPKGLLPLGAAHIDTELFAFQNIVAIRKDEGACKPRR
jgi:FkbM family methyltransferase